MQRFLSVAVAVCALCGGSPACAQYTAHSVAQLRFYSSFDDATVTMAPGTYWLTQNGSNPNFVEFTGDNATIDLSAAQFKVDTRQFDGYGGGTSVNLFALNGANLTLRGLDLEGVDVDLETAPNAQRWSDQVTNYVRLSGTNNTLEDAKLIVRGSTPFGYGDAFGKGGAPSGANQPGGVPFYSHHKGLGVWVRESMNATIDGLDLEMHAFGHGVYMQAAQGLNTIKNTSVVGELFNSNGVIEHPLYQQYGVNTYDQIMYPDIMISGSEDGIRSYGEMNVNGTMIGTGDIYLENVRVERMREAFSLFAALGTATVINGEAYDNETGFEPGDNTTIIGGKANATNGPVLYYRADNIDNTQVEIELVGNDPQPGRDWDITYISGNNHEIKITNGGVTPGVLSENSLLRLSQRFNDWRHNQGGIDDVPSGRSTRNLSFMNTSGQNLMIGTRATTGSGVYSVTSGNVLGGSGSVFTAQDDANDSITIEVGGRLDPVGDFNFDLGDARLILTPAVTVANSAALHFELGSTAGSDCVHLLAGTDLLIGDGVLEFDDFVFTTTADFAGGVFTLFTVADNLIGSIGTNFTGQIDSRDAVLSLAEDNQSILLSVDENIPGDFDGNSVVNGRDALYWLRNGHAAADLAKWERNFGAGIGELAQSLAVPEPASMLLLLATIGFWTSFFPHSGNTN